MFPGLLGVALYRLRTWMCEAPVAAVGPLLGLIAADMAVDIAEGRYGSAGIELLIAPLLAVTVVTVARLPGAGLSGLLLLVLGGVSALGASMLLTIGLTQGAGTTFVLGCRHLGVAAYAWAAIAEEPPPRRPVYVPVRV